MCLNSRSQLYTANSSPSLTGSIEVNAKRAATATLQSTYSRVCTLQHDLQLLFQRGRSVRAFSFNIKRSSSQVDIAATIVKKNLLAL